MPAQAYPYLVLTDGSDVVTFWNGLGTLTNWPPVRGQWAPAVAGTRLGILGGRGPYADVVERIRCNVQDTTAALVFTDLATLARLLDKAERWWVRNEPINPVVLKYVPQGSTVHSSSGTMLQAVVLGRVGNDELVGIELPGDTSDAGLITAIQDITVQLLRRGAWTGASDTTGASGSAANATVLTRSLSSHPTTSPLSVTIGGFDGTATPTIKAGYLIVGSDIDDIQPVEAEGATATAFTSVADSTNLARGGSVLRYTPTDTNPKTTGNIPLTLIGDTIAVIAAVRNNSGTTTWQIRANLSGSGTAFTTPTTTIDTSSTQPRLVLLGITRVNAVNNLTLTVTASAASGTLDIDYLIVVNLRDATVTILAHDDISLAGAGAGSASLQALYNPTTDKQPTFWASGGSGNVLGTYRGALPFLTVGTDVYALWTATNGQYWRFTNTSNAVVNVTLNVTRYRSYLTPT